MRTLVGALVFLVACGTPRTAYAPLLLGKPSNPVKGAIGRTVFLRKSGCSGVAMGDNRMVTAKHCLPKAAKAGDSYEGGELKYISPAYDFAVVAFPDGRGRVGMRTPGIGDHVYVVGYPVQLGSDEQELTVTDGLIAGPVNSEGEARITAPAYFGNSGGGVWSDEGELVGILVSGYFASVEGYDNPVPYVGQSYMVPVDHIKGWL